MKPSVFERIDEIILFSQGNMWWTKSDDIWQTLACCMEIKSAIESGDPENYVCHFPVHQDGSCNGLQHYAALGRDELGGRSVNLVKSEFPQDVYSCVVERVSAVYFKSTANETTALLSTSPKGRNDLIYA